MISHVWNFSFARIVVDDKFVRPVRLLIDKEKQHFSILQDENEDLWWQTVSAHVVFRRICVVSHGNINVFDFDRSHGRIICAVVVAIAQDSCVAYPSSEVVFSEYLVDLPVFL